MHTPAASQHNVFDLEKRTNISCAPGGVRIVATKHAWGSVTVSECGVVCLVHGQNKNTCVSRVLTNYKRLGVSVLPQSPVPCLVGVSMKVGSENRGLGGIGNRRASPKSVGSNCHVDRP